ncbi:Hypothetical protein PHPALM_17590 [Phytophthora palmivora]|uniref:RxLR effector n=1 Tax=Phytophthora palmivora TaxID=4796 RepID=A0A2P4XLU3_9STRA|nr:Hypothetical protein PHPALM_17590 [Phytophthora palmivora]
MREVFCILVVGFVTLVTHSTVVTATDSIENSTCDTFESQIIPSADDTVLQVGTTNDDTTVVDKKALFVGIRMFSGPETEERNILGSRADVIFKVLGKFVSPATLDKWKENFVKFTYAIAYKLGTTPDHMYTKCDVVCYTKAQMMTNPNVRAKYMQASDRYAAYWATKSVADVKP